jgi:glutamine amidotransferase
MAVAIVDLGLGNLSSVRWSFARLGASAVVTTDADVLEAAAGIVLPGVGSFGAGAARLSTSGLRDVLWRRIGVVPVLGICLGMQLLFDRSEEGALAAASDSPRAVPKGLGVLSGVVVKLKDVRPLPHMGWNTVRVSAAAGIMAEVGSGDAYFCHSYVADPQDALVQAASTKYGTGFASAVQHELVTGVQFHPERSGAYGQAVLGAFWRQVHRCSR